MQSVPHHKMKWLLLFAFIAPAICRQIESFIVGGSGTTIGSHPWQLSLRSSSLSTSHTCGASLVSATRGITAAHCVAGGGNFYVMAGSTDRTCPSSCQTRAVTNYVIHPNYQESPATGYPNDIAVLSFSSISESSSIQYIPMASSSSGSYAGETCEITGWGRTCDGCSLPLILQLTNMDVMTNTACTLVWGAARINDGHVCVESASGNSGACNGDSGGPLVCRGTLVGATSWVASGCLTSYPSVYTRISYFRSWIDGQM